MWVEGTYLGAYLGMSMTLAQAAEALDLSPATLRWQIHKGKLAAQKVGPIWLVEVSDVMRYRQEHKRTPNPET